MIVRFKQIDKYPDSTRSVGTIVSIDTEAGDKPAPLPDNHKASEAKEYAEQLAKYESKKEWIKNYIKFFETYPNIYKKLEEGEE